MHGFRYFFFLLIAKSQKPVILLVLIPSFWSLKFLPCVLETDGNRYFYQDGKSMSSIFLNWEVMFVQDGLSEAKLTRS